MEPWPLWRQELSEFYAAMAGTEFRVFRRQGEDGLWMGIESNDWDALREDEPRRILFVTLRERLFNRIELDPELGLNSLDNIINHYFGDYLEVR